MIITYRQKTHFDFPGYIFCNSGNVISLSRSMKPCLIKSKNGEYYQYRVRDKNIKLYQFYPSTIQRKFFPYDWIELLYVNEEAKQIKDYPGYYITTKGRIWSMKQYKFITPNKVNKQGNLSSYHYKVVLGLGNNTPRLHTLVGRNFLPDYQEGLHILHKEETLPYPEINYVENLYVGTHRDNMRDIMIKKKNNHERYR